MMSDKDDFYRRMRAGDGPAWRWQRVQNLIMADRRPDKHDDEPTKVAWRMCKTLSATPEARPSHGRRYGKWLQAYLIHSANNPRRWEIEARLLTGASAADIATKLKIEAEVVDAYATLFFDVIGRLQAHDWIWCTAVRVGWRGPSKLTEADIWRYFAVSGGSVVLDVLVSDYLGVEPVYPDRHQLAEDIRALVYFTTTPMADKKQYRRAMDRMWEILATRVRIIDEAQFQQVFAQMELLEITAGLRKAPSARKERRSSSGRTTKAARAGDQRHLDWATFAERSEIALKIIASGTMIPTIQPQLGR